MLWKMLVCIMGLPFLLAVSPLQSAIEDKNVEDLEEMPLDAPQSYILPLSYDEDPPLLIIPVPDELKLAYNGSSYPDVMYLQFIPQGENINYWSEMITICQSTE